MTFPSMKGAQMMEKHMAKLTTNHALNLMATKKSFRVGMGRRLSIFYNRRMAVNPYQTTMFTGALIVPVGDFVCQYFTRGDKKHDWWRSAGMMTFGLMYIGVFNAWLYRRYVRWFKHVKNVRLNLACRVMTDNLIHIPLIWLPTFYFWTGTFKGESTEEISGRLKESYLMAVLGSWLVWVPTNTLNFSIVPPQLRVLFMCCISLCDKVRLSYMSNRNLVKGVSTIAKST